MSKRAGGRADDELRFPQVEEAVDLVEEGALGGRRGLGVGGDVANLAVVVAEVGLGSDADRLAVVVGLHDLGGDSSPGADGQRRSRHLRPPTWSTVGCSTVDAGTI
jgi:hypothetical protein